MTIDERKYTVVRTDRNEILSPGTYFVLRRKDTFGAAGLYAYANSIQTVLELAQTRKDLLSEDELKRLSELADYVADLARQWQTQDRKVPD